MLNFTTNRDGCPPVSMYDNKEDFFKHQLQIDVSLKLGQKISVVFRSLTKEATSYEIFDAHGKSMGKRVAKYGILSADTGLTSVNIALVEDLNVLLEEFGVQLECDELAEVTMRAMHICDSRYGNGNDKGDVIVTFT